MELATPALSSTAIAVASLSSEHAPDHARGNGARPVARVQRRRGHVGSLAELVAPREGDGIGYREDQGDDCMVRRIVRQRVQTKSKRKRVRVVGM